MKPTLKYLILFFSLSVILAASMYFSHKRLQEAEPPILVVDGAKPQAAASASAAVPPDPVQVVSGLPAPDVPANAGSGRSNNPVGSGSLAIPNCHEMPEYIQFRRELGRLVNKTSLKRENPTEYLKSINEFREKAGLPLPLGLTSKKLEEKNIVYNNCKNTCHGAVNQVFISRIIGNRYAEVLLKSGKLEQFPLHESGLEVATIDELNHKGVPFRSWFAPMSDGPWYVKGNVLYYNLDFSGYSLAITSGKSNWDVVPTPKDLEELKAVEPLSKDGCTREEQCLLVGKRVFKAPNVCLSVVKHSNDEEAPPKPTPEI